MRDYLIGPFMGEVGFEVLYWIPFIRQRFKDIDPARVTIVSRGGVQDWYGLPRTDYRDILSVMSPAEFGKLNALRVSRRKNRRTQKQLEPDDIDRHVLRSLGLEPKTDAAGEGVEWIHPSWIYRKLQRKGGAILEDLEPPPVPARSARIRTVVKFYARPSFPRTPATERLVAGVLRGLLKQGPVVALASPQGVDDHQDFPVPDGVEVYYPRTHDMNLAEQTNVIRQAEQFVGTYGGFSYIALAHGVPSYTYATQPRHYHAKHLAIAQRRAGSTGTRFEVIHESA